MTISEHLKKFINEFDGADFSDIATDFIEGEEGSYAIFKSPNKTVVKYNDGNSLVTEYYQFFARQSSQIDKQRIGNQALLENFEQWIEDKDFEEDYPELENGCTCTELAVTNSATMTSEEEDEAIYQITISIQYMKER